MRASQKHLRLLLNFEEMLEVWMLFIFITHIFLSYKDTETGNSEMENPPSDARTTGVGEFFDDSHNLHFLWWLWKTGLLLFFWLHWGLIPQKSMCGMESRLTVGTDEALAETRTQTQEQNRCHSAHWDEDNHYWLHWNKHTDISFKIQFAFQSAACREHDIWTKRVQWCGVRLMIASSKKNAINAALVTPNFNRKHTKASVLLHLWN